MMFVFTFLSVGVAKQYCSPGDPCWPSASEVEAFSNSLNPEQERILFWEGPGNPRVSAVPSYSPDDQPLFGFAATNSMVPVYTLGQDPPGCFTQYLDPNNPGEETRPGCFVSIRNNPFADTRPGFVVWALNSDHVQKAVRFAVEHDLCVAVAGTGHDFMGRHECKNGLFIRTTLMKGMDFDTEDSRGYGWDQGNVRAGAGVVFSEIHKEAADRGLVVSSGWAVTVGIAGWTLGGGHGPLANVLGLGVDNLLEAEIVTADGEIIRANKNQHSDLFWALRGGGGSTWGIVTEFTLRTHRLPEGGLTFYEIAAEGDNCGWWKFWANGKRDRNRFVRRYLDWSLSLGPKWSGLTFLNPSESTSKWECGGKWSVTMEYIYFGPEEEGQEQLKKLPLGFLHGLEVKATPVSTYWEFAQYRALEPISPVNWLPNGAPSVLVSREKTKSGKVAKTVLKTMDAGGIVQFYQDITGNKGAPQEEGTAITPLFREALFHMAWAAQDEEPLLALGENSYFGEASYHMPGWKQRLWGANYDRLAQIKQTYDPESVFWCRQCVGDDDTEELISSLADRRRF